MVARMCVHLQKRGRSPETILLWEKLLGISRAYQGVLIFKHGSEQTCSEGLKKWKEEAVSELSSGKERPYRSHHPEITGDSMVVYFL